MVNLVRVERAILVANMVAQRDMRAQDGVLPILYDALLECLKQLGFHAHQLRASVHMPRIGRGLAGGEWEKVEPLISETLLGTQIFGYDLPR
jgi:O-acetyl-ADP-ribose deacetylase (regulator of RNase III)